MPAVSREAVLKALSKVTDPEEGKNIVRLDLIRNLRVEDGRVSLTIVLERPDTPFARQVEEACRRVLHEEIDRTLAVDVDVDSEMISLGDDMTVGDQGGAEAGAPPAACKTPSPSPPAKAAWARAPWPSTLALALAAAGLRRRPSSTPTSTARPSPPCSGMHGRQAAR